MKRFALVLAIGALVVAGCGGGGSTGAGAGGSSEAPQARTLTVFAAASLTDAFGAIARRFETDNPGVTVKLNFAGSSDLAQQIVNGAPADVFAAASETTMKTVTDAALTAGPPTVFARNVLQIATAPGNPKQIMSFADLAKPGVKVVVCAPQVPCGSLVTKIEKSTGVMLAPVSEEPDVKSTLNKVATGNADAALVYTTDVTAAKGSVQGVSFPESASTPTNYPIAVGKNAPQPELAARFRDLVTGEFGQQTLQAAGFNSP